MKKFLWVLATLILIAVGWYVYSQRGAPGDTDAEAAALLSYVPADAAYVVAPLQTMPPQMVADLLKQAEPALKVWASMVADMRKALTEQDNQGSRQLLVLFDVLGDEFRGKSMVEGVEHTGVGRSGLSAIYAIDLVPVMRVKLDDSAKMVALIERVNDEGGLELERRNFAGNPLWRLSALELDGAALRPVVAIAEDYLVITVVPADTSDEVMRSMIGLDKPALSLAQSGELATRAASLGLLPYSVGYIDTGKLLTKLTRADGPVAPAFLAALGQSKPSLDPTCLGEIDGLAKRFPGMSFGYSKLDAKGSIVRMLFEFDAETSAELIKLRAPMPGGPMPGDTAIFDFGFAVSLKELPGVVERLTGRVTKEPFACTELAPLNAMTDEVVKAFKNPAVFAAAPMVSGLRVVLDDLSFGPDGSTPSGSGTILLGSDNPQSLIGMVKGVVPLLGELQIPTDGSAVLLPEMPGLPGAMPPMKLAQTDKMLGIAIGDIDDAQLKSRLTLDPSYQPAIRYGFSGRMFTVLADGLDQVANTMLEGEEQSKMLAQGKLMRDIYPGLFDHSEVVMEFTERGVEIRQDTRMVQ